MMAKTLIGLYAGEIFGIIFIVSSVLFKEEQKNYIGRVYGKILWRFYKIGILELLLAFILNASLYTMLLIFGLLVNIYLSYHMKSLKQSIGNIDNINYNNPIRVKFRNMSKISSGILVLNMFLAILYVLR